MYITLQYTNPVTIQKEPSIEIFDKEQIDKTMVKRLKSQGCTPGMIAKKMNLPQSDVDTLIQKIRDEE